MTTVSTAAEIRELISHQDRNVVLLDSGGFTWWSNQDRYGDFWLEGCAGTQDPDEHGLAIQAWMNSFTPEKAAEYGPFTVISDVTHG